MTRAPNKEKGPPYRQGNRDRNWQSRETRSHGDAGKKPDLRMEEVWAGYLQNGYFDQGAIRPEYVSRKQVENLVKEMAFSRPALTKHQVRRFFQHCRAIEAKLKRNSEQQGHQKTWESLRVEFLKLDTAAADAFGKNPRKIPRLFYDFIRLNVQQVQNERDFLHGFLPHFEALVGFGSLHLKEQERS